MKGGPPEVRYSMFSDNRVQDPVGGASVSTCSICVAGRTGAFCISTLRTSVATGWNASKVRPIIHWDPQVTTRAVTADRQPSGERQADRALKPGAGFVSLDAKAFTGQARVLNPVLGPVFKYTTNWNYHKNVVESLREIFGELDVEEYNGGCNYLAVGVRRSGSSSR